MYVSIIKPLFDLIGALVLLVLLLPVLLITSLLIYLKMSRPIFFRQARPGKDTKIFHILKFRTMRNAVDKEGNLLEDSMRLDSFGEKIRSLSLDELPQLINVLKGEMSFIGPRPLLIEYLPLYTPEQQKRHNVKPGISGWAQVNGRNAISWQKKFELDSYYAQNVSFALDMKIVYMTLLKVIKKEGITSSNHVSTEKFNGKN